MSALTTRDRDFLEEIKNNRRLMSADGCDLHEVRMLAAEVLSLLEIIGRLDAKVCDAENFIVAQEKIHYERSFKLNEARREAITECLDIISEIRKEHPGMQLAIMKLKELRGDFQEQPTSGEGIK